MAPESHGKSERAPRRIVLLAGDESSEVRQIFAEFRGTEVSGKRVHDDLQKLAAQHPGRLVAAEWEGPLGWTRFLWCRH
jgi:hypothetical protein